MNNIDKEKSQTDSEKSEITSDFEFGGMTRDLNPVWTWIVALIGVAYVCFHIVVLNFLSLDAWVFRTLHVNIAAILAFALYAGWSTGRKKPSIFDLVLMASALYAIYYIWSELDMLIFRTGVSMTTLDVVVAIAGIVVILEFTRRTSGLALPILASIFASYCLLGPWLPGVLYHRGYDISEVSTFLYSMEGIFGIATAAAAQYIVLFVIFAAFLKESGAGKFFMNFAFALTGWARGGAAKVSLLGSALFGMISGSSVTNVVASGTFSIPMMRRSGYKPSSAAAIEAAASTGGQLAPPVMGAGAFIMAEVTGIPYTSIIIAALIPCLLYYFSVYVQIDTESQKENIHGLPRSELPSLRPMLGEMFVLLPLGVLLAFLAAGFSIIPAGTWGILSAIPVMLVRRFHLNPRVLSAPLVVLIASLVFFGGLPANLHGLIAVMVGLFAVASALVFKGSDIAVASALRETGKDIFVALRTASVQTLQLVAVCACAGIVVGVIGLTGLGGRFSSLLLGVAGESQFLALIFAMVIAIILGMGMPTTAAYAIAASVVAPSLVVMGFDVLSAHLFVFYFAVVSTITPPIALSAFAGAALAGSNPWKTSLKAVKCGIAAFIVPYIFIYHQGILLEGSLWEITQQTVTAMLGIWSISVAIEGWFRGKIGIPSRLLFMLAMILLVIGSVISDLMGLGILITLVIYHRFKFREKKADI